MKRLAEIVQAIHTNIPEGINMDPDVEQKSWHGDVQEFIAASPLEEHEYAVLGRQLVFDPQQYQQNTTLFHSEGLLGAVMPIPSSNVEALASIREHLVIGRNIHDMVSATALSASKITHPIPKYIDALGEYIDSGRVKMPHGFGGKPPRIRLQAAKEAAEVASAVPGPKNINKGELMARVAASLHTHDLVDGSHNKKVPVRSALQEVQTYRPLRQGVHRVVNLVLANVLHETLHEGSASEGTLAFYYRSYAINQAYLERQREVARMQSYL